MHRYAYARHLRCRRIHNAREDHYPFAAVRNPRTRRARSLRGGVPSPEYKAGLCKTINILGVTAVYPMRTILTEEALTCCLPCKPLFFEAAAAPPRAVPRELGLVLLVE